MFDLTGTTSPDTLIVTSYLTAPSASKEFLFPPAASERLSVDLPMEQSPASYCWRSGTAPADNY
jgi:hypothetical protein